jgi:hypothetical protein
MNDLAEINASRVSRPAYIYLRQSTHAQLEHNRESKNDNMLGRESDRARLGGRCKFLSLTRISEFRELGWSNASVLGLTAEVALGHVGIVLGPEVSRLARNNADWYRLSISAELLIL